MLHLSDWSHINNRVVITFGSGPDAREWRGRILLQTSMSFSGMAPVDIYVFAVTPFGGPQTVTPDDSGGGLGGGGGPGDVTVVVTNPQGNTAPATASPTQVPID